MSDNQAETALPGVVVTGEAKEALELDDQIAPMTDGVMRDGWFAVQSHIVGDIENWGYCYHHEAGRYSTRQEAITAGLRQFDSDDFNVGRVKGGVLMEFGWMNNMFEPNEVAEEAAALGLSARSVEDDTNG